MLRNFWISFTFIIVTIQLFGQQAQAVKIRFPEDELAKESVLPVFDKRPAVLDRRVKTDGRVEVGGFAGSNLNEPFNSGRQYGLFATYHFTELHGFNFVYSYVPRDLTSYVKESLDPDLGTGLNKAPFMKSYFLGNYQYTPYYGKISLTKSYTMNLSLFVTAGLGMVMIGDKSLPTASLGLGQKFYMSSNFALRFDLKMLAYNGPNVLQYKGTGALKDSPGQASASSFKQELYLPLVLTAGAVFLF